MQERHTDRRRYFDELALTSERYFMPYIMGWHGVERGMRVLEIGCGEGGNLLPFAEKGCDVIGVDMAECRIDEARMFFADQGVEGTFIAEDIFNLKTLEQSFDLIICHDVIEHIGDKEEFMSKMSRYLKPDGIVFMSFPAWQMPFGGHQQICRSRVLSHLPFVHLLPACLYGQIISAFGEDKGCKEELMSIKSTSITVEYFERLARQSQLKIQDRQLWLINPHYEVKFGFAPRRLSGIFSNIPYFRNFLSTSCFYILQRH